MRTFNFCLIYTFINVELPWGEVKGTSKYDLNIRVEDRIREISQHILFEGLIELILTEA